jgi:Tfp pilus assembly protein PilF
VKIEQFATRDLSPAEARALAQKALQDDDLFDALVAQGAVEASLDSPAVRASVRRPSRRMPWLIAFGVAAAVLLAVFLWRGSRAPVPQPAERARAIAPAPSAIASLDPANTAGPVLIATEISPARPANTTAFRGDAAPVRQPQPAGKITAIEDGEATVNLGSLDGLAQGTELGAIVISTVFRDHARGKLARGASVHVNDPVQVPSAIHLAAVLHEVDALAASGNLAQARDLARGALANGSSAETRPLLIRLAALDYEAGALDVAREHYEAAANNFFAPPAASPSERAAALNALGALYLLRGDPASAVKPLSQAALITAIDPALRAQVLNNIGAMSEMTGDLAQARDNYQRAAAEKAPAHQHDIAQANAARIANLKRP